MRVRTKKQWSEPDPGAPYSFSLLLPGQKKVTGELAGVDMSHAAMSFPVRECPNLERDERIRLSLTLVESRKTLDMDALVKGSRSSKDRVLYQFKLIDTDRLLREQDPVLTGLFNRRGAFRVKPDPQDPISVDLIRNIHSGKGSMIDISTLGVALRVLPSSAPWHRYADQVSISFTLPGSGDTFRLDGRIARVSPLEKGTVLGVEFDRDKTKRIRPQEQSISRYVLQRQLAR